MSRKNIFLGVLARCTTNFLMSNRYINTSVQKAGIPGFPRCLEHSQTIWNSILSAKRDKRKLHVIWLDFANAYDGPQFFAPNKSKGVMTNEHQTVPPSRAFMQVHNNINGQN